MQITLPVSGEKLTLKSWSMAKADEFYEAEMAMLDMDATARVAPCASCGPKSCLPWASCMAAVT